MYGFIIRRLPEVNITASEMVTWAVMCRQPVRPTLTLTRGQEAPVSMQETENVLTMLSETF